jgi:tetratricopeptide (TPR) repeat protein
MRTHDLPDLKIHHHREGLQPGKDERIALLKLAIRESPEYPFLKLQLGLEHLLREEWGQAVGPLKAYIDTRHFDGVLGKAVAYMQLGRAKARYGDLQGSMDAFIEAGAAAPARREPRYWAAVELIRAAMPWEAIPWLEEALKIEPKALPEFALYSEEAQSILIQETLDACRAMIDEAKRKLEEQRRGSAS